VDLPKDDAAHADDVLERIRTHAEETDAPEAYLATVGIFAIALRVEQPPKFDATLYGQVTANALRMLLEEYGDRRVLRHLKDYSELVHTISSNMLEDMPQ